jgi:hypothetical protein
VTCYQLPTAQLFPKLTHMAIFDNQQRWTNSYFAIYVPLSSTQCDLTNLQNCFKLGVGICVSSGFQLGLETPDSAWAPSKYPGYEETRHRSLFFMREELREGGPSTEAESRVTLSLASSLGVCFVGMQWRLRGVQGGISKYDQIIVQKGHNGASGLRPFSKRGAMII